MSQRILISGSVAYDTIMVFDGHFKDHILPDRVHMLNVAFLTPRLKREFGGCAANIAYTLRALGGEPVILATVGQDGREYLDRLTRLQIDTSHVRMLTDHYTAQAFITTDMADNQIDLRHTGPGRGLHRAGRSVAGAGPAPAGRQPQPAAHRHLRQDSRNGPSARQEGLHALPVGRVRRRRDQAWLRPGDAGV